MTEEDKRFLAFLTVWICDCINDYETYGKVKTLTEQAESLLEAYQDGEEG